MMTSQVVQYRTMDGWNRPIVVKCRGIRGMAYRDMRGKLRSFWTRKLLSGPVQILDSED